MLTAPTKHIRNTQFTLSIYLSAIPIVGVRDCVCVCVRSCALVPRDNYTMTLQN